MFFLAAPLYGPKHLIGLLVIALLFVVFSKLLSAKKERNNRSIILVFLIIFYLLEIIKLSYMTYKNGSFPIYQLPFHLCSLPLYLYPIMYLFPNAKFTERFIKPMAYAVVMLAGIMALAMPTTIIGNALSWLPLSENVLPILSFLYHGLMIFASVFLLRSGFYQFQINDSIRAVIATILFAVVAMTMNHYLDTDFMLLNRGTGSPFQFLLNDSRFLYLAAMIGLGVFLITANFFITDKIYNFKKENKIITSE